MMSKKTETYAEILTSMKRRTKIYNGKVNNLKEVYATEMFKDLRRLSFPVFRKELITICNLYVKGSNND